MDIIWALNAADISRSSGQLVAELFRTAAAACCSRSSDCRDWIRSCLHQFWERDSMTCSVFSCCDGSQRNSLSSPLLSRQNRGKPRERGVVLLLASSDVLHALRSQKIEVSQLDDFASWMYLMKNRRLARESLRILLCREIATAFHRCCVW